jgi:hypothetical protein
MTTVETPTAAMKILWSRSQQPCSSQLTAILWSPPQIYSSALRLEFGGGDVQAGGGARQRMETAVPGALARWNWKRAGGCGRRNRERERWAGGCVRAAYGPRDFDCSSPRSQPADAIRRALTLGRLWLTSGHRVTWPSPAVALPIMAGKQSKRC